MGSLDDEVDGASGSADTSSRGWSQALVITKGEPGNPPIVSFCGVDVARMNAEIILAGRALALAPFVPLMRNGATEEAMAAAARIIHEEVSDAEGAEDLVMFLAGLASYFRSSDRVRAVVADVWGSEETLDRAMRRYFNYQEGRRQGWRQGTLLLLGGRIGTIPAALEKAIMRASIEQLAEFARHLATGTLEQLAALLGIQLT